VERLSIANLNQNPNFLIKPEVERKSTLDEGDKKFDEIANKTTVVQKKKPKLKKFDLINTSEVNQINKVDSTMYEERKTEEPKKPNLFEFNDTNFIEEPNRKTEIKKNLFDFNDSQEQTPIKKPEAKKENGKEKIKFLFDDDDE
jgi:hypothetical protein